MKVFSFGALLRMDGIPALDLWDVVLEVLHPSLHQPVQGNLLRDKEQTRKRTNTRREKHPDRDDLELCFIEPTKYPGKLVQQWAIRKKHQNQNEETQWPREWWVVYCRSRCHKRKAFPLWRLAFHYWRQWGCDLDEFLKVEVRRWDTCPVPTKLLLTGYFTESTWIQKFKSKTSIQKTNSPTFWRKAVSFVMNGIIFSVCSTSWTFQCFLVAMSVQLKILKPCRRGRYTKEDQEKMNVWLRNEKPMWTLASQTVDRSPRALGLSASHSPETLDVKPVRGDWWWKRHRIPLLQDCLTKTWRYPGTMLTILRMSTSNIRQNLGRQPGDDMPEIVVNAVIWGIFMSATLKAAVQLGQDYQDNLRTTKNTDFDNIKYLFDLDFVERQSRQAVESKGIRFLWFGTLSWQN